MDEDEAALLAELRAISNKSATSRFVEETIDGDYGGLDEQENQSHSANEERAGTAMNCATGNSHHSRQNNGFNAATTSAFLVPSDDINSTNPDREDPAEEDAILDELLADEDDTENVTTLDPYMGGAGNFHQPSAFQGERGGVAEDEELLAELRAVSAKSSGADRFVNDNDGEVVSEDFYEPKPAVTRKSMSARSSSSGDSALPPWKRKQKGPTQQANIEIVTAGTNPQSSNDSIAMEQQPNAAFLNGGGGTFKQESTFSGDRGGSAEDAELLALLRGVSAKSGAADRFANDEESDFGAPMADPAPVPQPKPAPKAKNQRKMNELPPWKRDRTKPKQVTDTASSPDQSEESEAVVLTKEAIMGGGGNFKQESTFSGDRGGSAEDAELLALLRGVSAKSGAADRFASEEGMEVESSAPAPTPASEPTQRSKKSRNPKEIPPWKRGKSQQTTSAPRASENTEAQQASSEPVQLSNEAIMGGGGNFKQESTFSGDRGGSAEDAELLALLRGVSATSGAADRFADDSNIETSAPSLSSKPAANSRNRRDDQSIPPWKNSKAKPKTTVSQKASTEAQKTSMASPSPQVLSGGGGNFKQESTFQGERGGAAEDEELLALLRGVSAKSSGANRFAEEDGDSGPSAPATEQKLEASKPLLGQALPQAALQSPANEAKLHSGGGNFKQESTFQGERGGAAEDEELLALLRGVSAKSGGADRFAEEGEVGLAPSAVPAVPPTAHTSPNKFSTPIALATPPGTPAAGEEIVVTRDVLPEYVTHSSWKVRKDCYILLRKTISEMNGGSEPAGTLDGNAVMAGLDEQIAGYLLDKNANAVEEAMQLNHDYFDHCRAGSSASLAEAITINLIKGNGFTSPRPKAAKIAQALVLKVMEVGDDIASISAVVGVLLDQGLTSRKPKIVQMSINLILEASYAFGAVCLPLAAIKQSILKVLAHSNKKIRDTGMEVVAELCRALGGKAALGDVIGQLKKPQQKDLDNLMQKRSSPSPIKVGLRSRRGADMATVSPEDAMATLQAGAAQLAAEQFAKRPAINLPAEINKTDYASHLKLAKWSEKVTGLKMVIACGGEKPYKLVQPTLSAPYGPLISEMKGLLSHTHFAVVGKALEVLAMLAEGVGEKLYPNLRPLLPKLFSLSKDKKLTKSVSSCLDSFFGNVLSLDHILDPDTAIPDATDERKEKNALARTSVLDFLDRCVLRGDSAGPRARMNPSSAKKAAKLSSLKLGDSDANVRKAALNVMKTLQKSADSDVRAVVKDIIVSLESSNPRAFKQLSTSAQPKQTIASRSSPRKRQAGPRSPAKATSSISNGHQPTMAKPSGSPAKELVSNPFANAISGGENDAPKLDDAIGHIASLHIPLWDAADDDGGVLEGLKSSKWLLRQNSIKAIAAFMESRTSPTSGEALQHDTACILALVKQHTRGFRETNVNVTKSILELYLAIGDLHSQAVTAISTWAAVDGATLSTQKIADKKLSSLAKSVLSVLCVVQLPHIILGECYSAMAAIKSPLAHEEMLKWIKVYANDFGVSSVGPRLQDSVQFLLDYCKSSNLKVKKAAFSTLGTFHVQLGPAFEALVMASIKDNALRVQAEKIFIENPFDPMASKGVWSKKCILAAESSNVGTSTSESGFQVEVPTMDLLAEIPGDCVTRMGSKDGKTAWKARKAAMEEVEAALKRCSGLLNTSRLRPLVDLLRAIRDRLSDSQSNLKPVAARLLGMILSKVDALSQAKLGKIVFGALINSALNDNRKVMHEACMVALRESTTLAKLEGDGPSELALEPFIVGLVGELDESDYKSAGIADVLELTESFVVLLPDLDAVASQGGNTLGSRFAKVLVQGLTSSKTEIRSASESLLTESVKNGVFKISTVKRLASRQKPAIQRAIAPIVTKIASKTVFSDGQHSSSGSTSKVAGDEEVVVKGKNKSTDRKGLVPIQKRTTKIGRGFGPKLSGEEIQKKESRSTGASRNASTTPFLTKVGSAGLQRSKAAVRSMTWPEYPEEPSGLPLLNALKKAWSPLIPPESTNQLFPDGGIKKQDDAMRGFELLSRAIAMERTNEGGAIQDQFFFIWRWMAYVLCCKESTVGLQGLLTLLSDFVNLLRSLKYELSDSEATVLLPHIFDKASAAKGRFKDTFMDLMEQMKDEAFVPQKRMGPFVCVPVIESSSIPKSRLLACRECEACVENIGLSGIGKKGVLAAAKALSEEKLQDNRNAFLDLVMLLLSRMNNDMQRFTRICGSSLSGKARSLIEERLTKGSFQGKVRTGVARASPQRESQARRTSAQRPLAKASPSKLPGVRLKQHMQSPGFEAQDTSADGSFQDELPALDLRLGHRDSPGVVTELSKSGGADLAKFSISSAAHSINQTRMVSPKASTSMSSSETSFDHVEGSSENPHVSMNLYATSEAFQERQPVDSGTSASESIGAAASLRARLMKIRERNKSTGAEDTSPRAAEDQPVGHRNAHFPVRAGEVNDDIIEKSTSSLNDSSGEIYASASMENSMAGSGAYLDTYLATVRDLLSRVVPLSEEDNEIIESTDVLKTLHAAISQQSSLAVGLSATAVEQLRVEIRQRANEVIETLTRLIGFGFNCHTSDISAGLSVPLLSVNLASLMAIFRSDDMSKMVRVEDLTVLIKEAGKALLDPRLAGTSATSPLDEVTSTQMVRAINKLAVQAATGATRHFSFEALMTLQQQLCLKVDASEDPVFNSRLSRVVTKLFARVVKAEESEAQPFGNVDMEAIVCVLEDTLVSCDQADEEKIAQDAILATKNLAKSLTVSILKASGNASVIRSHMNDLDIDSASSALGKLVTVCVGELGFTDTSPRASRDIASLVTAVGEAPQGPEREAAIDALRKYKAIHGEEELKCHLEGVSAAFRAFIYNQLIDARLDSKTDQNGANSMSERIKNLRSKLNATEAVVQSAVVTADPTLNKPNLMVPVAHESEAMGKSTVRAFRQRLAAAQEKRTATSSSEAKETKQPAVSAGSRAAALRARLQAVKRQGEREEY